MKAHLGNRLERRHTNRDWTTQEGEVTPGANENEAAIVSYISNLHTLSGFVIQ